MTEIRQDGRDGRTTEFVAPPTERATPLKNCLLSRHSIAQDFRVDFERIHENAGGKDGDF